MIILYRSIIKYSIHLHHILSQHIFHHHELINFMNFQIIINVTDQPTNPSAVMASY